jgi:hypothetical protein
MENQQTQHSETSSVHTKSHRKNNLPGIGLVLGITATSFAIIWMMTSTDTGVPSNLSEIKAQMEFQKELIRGQEEFQQKVDAARKEAEQKSDSILKTTDQTR